MRLGLGVQPFQPVCQQIGKLARSGRRRDFSCRSSAAGSNAGLPVSQTYTALVDELVERPNSLDELASSHPQVLSVGFLQWLADREAEASGSLKADLSCLGGRLIAVREGIDAASLERVRSEIAARQADAQQLPAIARALHLQGDQPELAALTDVEARKRALARHQAASALSPQQAALAEQQVAALQAGIRDQKARSALELMGRKQLSPADLQAGLGEAEAAARILQVLLDVPDDMQRLALLPEAFAPASEEHLAAGNADEDLLSTSPWRLLQAVDHRLLQWDADASIAVPAIAAPRPEQHQSAADERAQLLKLRDAIQAYVFE